MTRAAPFFGLDWSDPAIKSEGWSVSCSVHGKEHVDAQDHKNRQTSSIIRLITSKAKK